MSKQDRQGVRTAADVERKYSLGDINDASKRSTKAEKQVSELDQKMNLFMTSVNKTIEAIQNRVNSFYPVGSIYISADATNPADIFGGTWERIQDRFLLAASSKYPNMTTGGEAEHKLTAAETPHVTGRLQFRVLAGANIVAGYPVNEKDGCFSFTREGGDLWANQGASAGAASRNTDLVTFDNGGQDKPHNNMPPYLAVYVWKRVQ